MKIKLLRKAFQNWKRSERDSLLSEFSSEVSEIADDLPVSVSIGIQTD